MIAIGSLSLSQAMYDLIGETDRKGDRDPKHRAEEIIRICDVTGNKKLTKEEVSLSSGPISVLDVLL